MMECRNEAVPRARLVLPTIHFLLQFLGSIREPSDLRLDRVRTDLEDSVALREKVVLDAAGQPSVERPRDGACVVLGCTELTFLQVRERLERLVVLPLRVGGALKPGAAVLERGAAPRR